MKPFSPFKALFISTLVLGSYSGLFAGVGQNGNAQNWDGSSKAFIENKGQFYSTPGNTINGPVLYGYDASSTRIFFSRDGVSFSFVQKSSKGHEEKEGNEKFKTAEAFAEHEREEKAAVLKSDLVSYHWEGCNTDALVLPLEETDEYFSYSIRHKGVERNEDQIKGYKKLLYKNIYPNIDVEYTLHPEGGIKYTLILHPGADLSKVKMSYSGKNAIDVN